MNNSVRKITKLLSIYVLLAIVGLIVFNKIFNTHTHIQADGVITTHAHPFDKTTENKPFKSHQHSSLELIALDTIDLFSAFKLSVFPIAVSAIVLYSLLPKFNLTILLRKFRLGERGPPEFFC